MVNPVQLFQAARTILCICPCCGDIVRLSDLTLHYKGETPLTWLDEYDQRFGLYEERKETFESKESAIRQASVEIGRKRATKTVRKLIRTTFPGSRYHPKDIKAILHPVDCIVFSGMTQKQKVSKIVMLSKESEVKGLQKIRESIRQVVEDRDYEKKVARVSKKGEITLE